MTCRLLAKAFGSCSSLLYEAGHLQVWNVVGNPWCKMTARVVTVVFGSRLSTIDTGRLDLLERGYDMSAGGEGVWLPLIFTR
jgi:hypothetical protein